MDCIEIEELDDDFQKNKVVDNDDVFQVNVVMEVGTVFNFINDMDLAMDKENYYGSVQEE